MWRRSIFFFESVLVFLFLYNGFKLPHLVAFISFGALALAIFFTNFFRFKKSKIWLSAPLLLTILFVVLFLFLSFFSATAAPLLAAAGAIIFFLMSFGLASLWENKELQPAGPFLHKSGLAVILSSLILFFISWILLSAKILFPVRLSWLFLGFISSFLLITHLNLSMWYNLSKRYLVNFAVAVIFGEIFLILAFAPIPISARSIIIVLAYYLFNGLLYLSLLPVLDKRLLRAYAGITIVSFLLVLISANWR